MKTHISQTKGKQDPTCVRSIKMAQELGFFFFFQDRSSWMGIQKLVHLKGRNTE